MTHFTTQALPGDTMDIRRTWAFRLLAVLGGMAALGLLAGVVFVVRTREVMEAYGPLFAVTYAPLSLLMAATVVAPVLLLRGRVAAGRSLGQTCALAWGLFGGLSAVGLVSDLPGMAMLAVAFLLLNAATMLAIARRV